jgi:hypothetical protein
MSAIELEDMQISGLNQVALILYLQVKLLFRESSGGYDHMDSSENFRPIKGVHREE